MRHSSVVFLFLASAALVQAVAHTAAAEERLVGPGQAYASIGDALADAVTGDVIVISAGTYAEALSTRMGGVTLRAASGEDVVVQTAGRVLDVQHADTTVEGLILDGEYGDRSPLRVQADGFTLRNAEVRRSTRDCVALGGVSNVLIEGSEIHRCLRSTSALCAAPGCREDAHGVSGGAVRGVTLRNTEIHTFSGDALQFDPGRDDAGWSDVRVESCRLWLAPLATAEGGFAAGVVAGENAIDTKTSNAVTAPAVLTVIDTSAWGFRGGLIDNMAAYNIKENVLAHFDRVHVYDSEIAFRLRGATGSRPRGAQVAIQNAVVYDVDTGIRYEDEIMPVRVWASTFGADVGRHFQDASAPSNVILAENLLFLASALPDEAMGTSSLAVDATTFVDAPGHDYHLAEGASPIDAGTDLPEVTSDRDGNARPIGVAHDVGAYEWCASGSCAPAADAGGPSLDAGPPGLDGGARPDGGTGPGADAGGDGGASEPSGTEGGCCSTVGKGSPKTALTVFAILASVVVVRRRRKRP